jgi:tetratricopeptide (TPR) repeat protein
MNAKEMGTQFADLMIATDPDKYVKKVDLDKWAENRLCDLAGECPDYFTLKCDGCEDSPKNKKTELYRYMEFRPFFRSLTNTALTLMKLKKYEQAIQTIKFCQEYQPLWGTFNMMGICYLSLGNVREADHWYNEFLWNDAYYIKALMKYLLGETENAFRNLIQGVIKNQYIAKMLVGMEKPDVIRYLGDALPDRLSASEFVHEHDYLFKQNPDFRNLIRCVLENDEISVLLDQLENDINRQTANPRHVMDKRVWNLLNGEIEDDFIQDYIPKLIERLNDRTGPYWKPKADDVLDLKIIEKKSQNWIVTLKNSEKQFYFRPKSHFGNNNSGDCIRICVAKTWFYRKSLYVSGEIEP